MDVACHCDPPRAEKQSIQMTRLPRRPPTRRTPRNDIWLSYEIASNHFLNLCILN